MPIAYRPHAMSHPVCEIWSIHCSSAWLVAQLCQHRLTTAGCKQLPSTLTEDNRPDSQLNHQFRPFEMCGLSRRTISRMISRQRLWIALNLLGFDYPRPGPPGDLSSQFILDFCLLEYQPYYHEIRPIRRQANLNNGQRASCNLSSSQPADLCTKYSTIGLNNIG